MTRNTRNLLVIFLAVVAGSITQEVIGRYWAARKSQAMASADMAPWTTASSLAGPGGSSPTTLLATASPESPPTATLATDRVAPGLGDAGRPDVEQAAENTSDTSAVPTPDVLAMADPAPSSEVPTVDPAASPASETLPADSGDSGPAMLQLVESNPEPSVAPAPAAQEPAPAQDPATPVDLAGPDASLVQTPSTPKTEEPKEPAEPIAPAFPPPEPVPAIPPAELVAQPQPDSAPGPALAIDPMPPPVFSEPAAPRQVEQVPADLAASPLVVPPSAGQYPIPPTPTSADAHGTSPRVDAQTLIRQRAVAKAEQRRQRIEARNWMGYSPTRPPVPSTPFTSGDNLRPIVVVVPQIVVETR